MCGLFAIIPSGSGDPALLRLFFQALGYMNDERGGHSWGVWGRDQAPVRGLGSIWREGKYLLKMSGKHWDVSEGCWLAGHTRFGTHGSISVQNAHPFRFGALHLAHNGIVQVSDYERTHPVDSGRLGMAIAELDLIQAMSKTSGSCALLLSFGSELLIYKHQQQLCMAKGSWGWAVSSDQLHLEAALKYVGLTGVFVQIEVDTFLAPWSTIAPIKAPMQADLGWVYDWFRSQYVDETEGINCDCCLTGHDVEIIYNVDGEQHLCQFCQEVLAMEEHYATL